MKLAERFRPIIIVSLVEVFLNQNYTRIVQRRVKINNLLKFKKKKILFKYIIVTKKKVYL